jgi:hypothetical protein
VVLTGAAKLRGYAPEVVDYVESGFAPAAQLRGTTFFLPKPPEGTAP